MVYSKQQTNGTYFFFSISNRINTQVNFRASSVSYKIHRALRADFKGAIKKHF